MQKICFREYITPLRYPGGKTKLTPFVKSLLEKNNLIGGIYCEPFAGGCGIAWHLLFGDFVSKIFINDLSPAIFSFWNAVIEQADLLCLLIENTPVTIEEWYRQKDILANNKIGLELGFATLFLNRTNRAGILTAGVTGGKEQTGNYKLNCRYNKEALIKKIQLIATRKKDIILTNLDANIILNEYVSKYSNVFINIDPPYYKKGKKLYQNFFKHKDHLQLFKSIKKLNHPWMVTYDNVEEIRNIYAEYNPQPFILNYSAQIKRKGSEVVAYSPNLITDNLKIGV